jgi:MFS family permease
MAAETAADPPKDGPLAVFRNGGFLRLWLSQAATQIGGNMVLFGLTILVVDSQKSNTAVSVLVLSFLVPAVLFSAVAGVYVDRIDRRLILVATNLLRGVGFVALYLVGTNLALILLLNFTISTITVFFAPAELAMIPFLVPRRQLLAANGIFTLTLNGAFAIGFALLGPLVVNLASPEAVILVVAALYFLAAVFCFTLPSAPPAVVEGEEAHHGLGVSDAERAVESTITELREGFGFIQTHRNIAWSLSYLAIAASLVGVLGVLGPAFAEQTLGLESKDFAVVVLPLGFGIVMGILLLNSYGKYFPRRRVIEGGMIVLGILLAALSAAGPISRLLQRADAPGGLDLSGVTSLLAVVVVIAFFAGIAYGLVAIPSQTQLQEDLPEDVRGRVFGVLGMLVSVASFLPIIIVGPISDAIGTTAVIFIMAVMVTVIGIISVLTRGPLKETEARPAADPRMVDPLASALGADLPTWTGHDADIVIGDGDDGVPAPGLATTIPPMPVGPAGDMPVPTGAEPDDGAEAVLSPEALARETAATAPPMVPGQERPDPVERG